MTLIYCHPKKEPSKTDVAQGLSANPWHVNTQLIHHSSELKILRLVFFRLKSFNLVHVLYFNLYFHLLVSL